MKKYIKIIFVTLIILFCTALFLACDNNSKIDVPAAPKNFTATAGNTQVILAWQEPESNGGSEIIKYEVRRNGAGGETWINAQLEKAYIFTDLTNGTEYTFKVRAVNEKGAGTEQEVKSTPTIAVPGQVSSFLATRGNGEIILVWVAPGNDGGSVITGYEVTKDNWATKVNKTSGELTHTFDNLTNGTEYIFKVRAVNEKGAGIEKAITVAPVAEFEGYVLPVNVKAVIGINNTTMTVIKIGDNYYSHNELTGSEYYLRSNGDETYTEYTLNNGSWIKDTMNTYGLDKIENSAYFGDVLNNAKQDFSEMEKTGSASIAGVFTYKYDTEYYSSSVTYYRNPETGVVFKKEATPGAYEITTWDTTITGFDVYVPGKLEDFLDAILDTCGNFTVTVTEETEDGIYNTMSNSEYAVYGNLSWLLGEYYENDELVDWVESYYRISGDGNVDALERYNENDPFTQEHYYPSYNNIFQNTHCYYILSILESSMLNKNGNIYTLIDSLTLWEILNSNECGLEILNNCMITITGNQITVIANTTYTWWQTGDETYIQDCFYSITVILGNANIQWPQ